MQQIEPSHQPRRDAKLPVITGAAAKNAGDADADLDEEGAPSSSALPPPSGQAKTAAASRAGKTTSLHSCRCQWTRQIEAGQCHCEKLPEMLDAGW